jgi:hypothetical protein
MGRIRARIIEALLNRREPYITNTFKDMGAAHTLKDGDEITLDAATSDIRFPTAEFPDTVLSVGHFGRHGVPWLARKREGTHFRAELRKGGNNYIALLWEYSGHAENGYRIRYRSNHPRWVH